MHASKRVSLTAVLALGLLSLGTVAHAGSTWVTANDCSDPGTAFSNSSSCSNGGGNATLSGWANTKNATGTNLHSGTTATGGKIEAAAMMLYTWTGTTKDFGVKNQNTTSPSNETTDPEHAIDNEVNVDMVLIKFDTASILSAFKLGWISGDSDVSVLRYDGSGTTAAGILGGLTVGGLTSNSWTVVNNYADVAGDTQQNTGADTSKSSSWWLISAYNSSFGTTSYKSGTLGDGNDYFKLLAYQATTPTGKTPEPSTLALAGLALLGIARSRRRATQ